MDKEIQVVAFTIGSEEYGVDILTVQEIIKVLTITKVPRAGNYIEGVINLRGNVIPVFNLHKRFGVMPSEDEEEARIVVFKFEDAKAGIIVDEVSEVLRIKGNEIEETAKVYQGLEAEFIQGVGKVEDRLLMLLNVRKLLSID